MRLVRPPAAPLSAMAQLGRRVFFDRHACRRRAGCPARPATARQHAYGPPNDAPAMMGGAALDAPGRARGAVADVSRAAAEFQHRPGQRRERDGQPAATRGAGQQAPRARRRPRRTPRRAPPTWCRRAACSGTAAPTRCRQALGPLLNPLEMDGGSVERVAAQAAARALRARASRSCSAPSVFDDAAAWRSPRRCSPWRATRSRTRPSIPTPASSMPGSKARRGSPPAEAARLSAVQRSAQGRIAPAAISTSRRRTGCRRCSPTISSRRWARRAIRRSRANRDPALLRPRHLRAVPHRHASSRRSIAACS